ncbi:hypothetical protein KYC5002_02790 [Archangium violaceum]|uniref:hypothetical protein n=1 Tax=Archangium violaceum TaxID=83451 RepID=UPI002B2CE5B0|nr:hypothetical protein KYC5002_02790 [Archangium gephyra]
MTEEIEVRRRDPMVVSLDLELSTIETAMRGAEILADYQIRQGYLDGESEKDAPECVFSILSLLGGRLEQVRRVIRGEEDPERLWGAHNAISLPESLDDVDGDIVLFPWNARGMPLVLARPSGWGVDPNELEERQAMGLEGLKKKEPKGPKVRKAKSPEGRKVKDRRERKGKEPEEQAPQSLSIQGAAPKEAPPVASEPT